VTPGRTDHFSSLNPIFFFKAIPDHTLSLFSSASPSLSFSLFNRQGVGGIHKSVALLTGLFSAQVVFF
jgi:hypothetical protein